MQPTREATILATWKNHIGPINTYNNAPKIIENPTTEIIIYT